MFVVEPARRSELKALVDLAAAALDPGIDPTWIAESAQDGVCMVAKDERECLVGFALARRESGALGHIVALAVDREYRGLGAGAMLMRSMHESLMQRGAMCSQLEVRMDNARAQAFYARHGYEPRGLHEHAFADGGDAVLLERPL